MAIQPIDLQTLFTQVDKVGKIQADQKEGLQIHQSLQGVQIQKKTEEQAQAINESKDLGQGAERISDQNAHRRNPGSDGSDEKKDAGAGETGEAAEDPSIIRDPALGNNIDISG
jgi:hypothetical protein